MLQIWSISSAPVGGIRRPLRSPTTSLVFARPSRRLRSAEARVRTPLKEKPMRIVHFQKEGVPGIAADDGSGWHGLMERENGFPATLPELIAQGADLLRIGRDLLPMHAIDLNAAR